MRGVLVSSRGILRAGLGRTRCSTTLTLAAIIVPHSFYVGTTQELVGFVPGCDGGDLDQLWKNANARGRRSSRRLSS